MGAHLLLPLSRSQRHDRVSERGEDPFGAAHGSPRDGGGGNDSDHIRQRVEEKYQAEIQECLYHQGLPPFFLKAWRIGECAKANPRTT
jgi:hypothetical protein